MRYLRGEVEFIIKPYWFECLELVDPKILPMEEGVAGLFFCEVFIGNLLDYYDPKISVEVVVPISKMAVYR